MREKKLRSPRIADDSLAELKAVLAASTDAIFTKTIDNVITAWSLGAERIYGYNADEIIGRPVALLFPQDRQDELDEIKCWVRAGGTYAAETVRLTKDERRIPVQVTVTPIFDAKGTVTKALSIAKDITKLKESESELLLLRERQHERSVVLETANRVAVDILASRTGVEALSHIAEAARTLARAKYAALGVARPDGQGLQEFVTVGLTCDEERAIGARPRGAGVLGLLLGRETALRVNSISSHESSVGFPPNHPPMKTFLGVPIRRGETVLGSLYLTEKEGGQGFTEADEIAVQAIAAHAAVAINNLFMMSRQRALVSGLINAQEEERRAIAYDLHDSLTQYVMASHMHMEAYRMAREIGNSQKADREVEVGISYLKQAVAESRRLVNGLRSLALEDLGLAGALEQLVEEEKGLTSWLDVDLTHNIADRRFDKNLEAAAYRVAQEALTNVRKHADSNRVRIMALLDEHDSAQLPTLTIEIRDWGKGFNPNEKASDYRHFGLHGINERVQLLDGKYKIESTVGSGTLVRAIFPVSDLDGARILRGETLES